MIVRVNTRLFFILGAERLCARADLADIFLEFRPMRGDGVLNDGVGHAGVGPPGDCHRGGGIFGEVEDHAIRHGRNPRHVDLIGIMMRVVWRGWAVRMRGMHRVGAGGQQ